LKARRDIEDEPGARAGDTIGKSTAPLEIRPIEPGDKAILTAVFEQSSDESRYRRFLGPRGNLSRTELHYLTEVDHHDHEALMALDPVTGNGVGVARYVRDRERPDSAEIAVAVVERWQGRGVGKVLLHRLAGRASEEGVGRFTALMLVDNKPMAHLLEDLGAAQVVSRDQGAVELAVDLSQRSTRPPPLSPPPLRSTEPEGASDRASPSHD
jgi:RimJ/RimL family protein N-acetyltransferase